ncbi:gluconate 2-dehydrogenase subunit 3 family protein [Rhizobium nepotum]|uniref:Gluconate 2-dehydrogenase n=1 Tax=Rhizobium nepotum 39/7 TaxID=1368418 RepID=A0ABR5CKK3_9HYPH|nr:gluconate 2-dehydrogenase subunit 3 family protein [Rhizobium nepotum]KJF65279.1 gluconate 2-dehydrogenase [Rhizobium nepotum 39/7]
MTDLSNRPTRRGFLKAGTASVLIAGIPVKVYTKELQPPVPLDQYERLFFTQEEWNFVIGAVARLIPSSGDGPGAIETRVPVFLDRQLAAEYGAAADWYMDGPHDPTVAPTMGYQTPLTPAELYRKGIQVFDQWCLGKHGKHFAALTEPQQDSALTALEGRGDEKVALSPELRDFFPLLLQNTKEGYFADPIYGGNHGMQAWVYIGFPGARAAYTEWISRHNVPYPLGPVSISGERA